MGDITEYFSDLSEVTDLRAAPLRETLELLEVLEGLETSNTSVVMEYLRSVPTINARLSRYLVACDNVRWGNRRVYSVLCNLRITSFKSIIGVNSYV